MAAAAASSQRRQGKKVVFLPLAAPGPKKLSYSAELHGQSRNNRLSHETFRCQVGRMNSSSAESAAAKGMYLNKFPLYLQASSSSIYFNQQQPAAAAVEGLTTMWAKVSPTTTRDAKPPPPPLPPLLPPQKITFTSASAGAARSRGRTERKLRRRLCLMPQVQSLLDTGESRAIYYCIFDAAAAISSAIIIFSS